MLAVESIHRGLGIALLSDGHTIPLVMACDISGNKCDDLDIAVAGVFGPDKEGRWHTADFSAFKPVTMN